VYPYGEPRNDWLDIDKDVARRLGSTDPMFRTISTQFGIDHSRAMLGHPRNSNLVGIINISSEKTPSFEVKLDREGFVENDAYIRLIDVIRLSLQWMTLHYNKFKMMLSDASFTEAREEFEIKRGIFPSTSSDAITDSRPLVENAFNVLHLEAKKVASQLPAPAKKESEELFDSALNVIQQS